MRLDKQVNEKEKTNFEEHANGQSINHVVKQLLNAYDPDTLDILKVKIESEKLGASPAEIGAAINNEHAKLIEDAVAVFNNPELRNYIMDVRKKYDQVMDHINVDEITNIGWVKDQQAAASLTISNFTAWIEAHKDEITALQIFYGQPYRRRELTYKMIKDLYEKIKGTKASAQFSYDRVLEGNLFRNTEEILQFFEVNIAVKSRFTDKKWKRIDTPFPKLALREGLMNALIHRDYSNVSGSVGKPLPIKVVMNLKRIIITCCGNWQRKKGIWKQPFGISEMLGGVR